MHAPSCPDFAASTTRNTPVASLMHPWYAPVPLSGTAAVAATTPPASSAALATAPAIHRFFISPVLSR
jgi:hypothetical protein